MDITPLMLLALVGAGTGFMAGLLGIGGGMILTPFFTLILDHAGFPPAHCVHMAIASSTATILFTSLSSVRAHARRNGVLWFIVMRMTPGIVLGALCGALVAGKLPTFWIALIFSTFVWLSATRMLWGRRTTIRRQLPDFPGLFTVGTGIGLLSAILGAGGGFISVPFMTRCGVRIQQAIGTSAALGFPIALAGTVGYVVSGWAQPQLPGFPMTFGYLYLPGVLAVALMSMLAAPWGAKIAHGLDTHRLKRLFACLLYALGTYMFLKALGRL